MHMPSDTDNFIDKGDNSNLTKHFVFEVCMTASVKDICKLRQFATSVQFKTVYDIISFYRKIRSFVSYDQ